MGLWQGIAIGLMQSPEHAFSQVLNVQALAPGLLIPGQSPQGECSTAFFSLKPYGKSKAYVVLLKQRCLGHLPARKLVMRKT